MTRKTRKLSLNKETVRHLSHDALRAAVGGTKLVFTEYDTCRCMEERRDPGSREMGDYEATNAAGRCEDRPTRRC